jgi:histidine triad (HIT) family protein
LISRDPDCAFCRIGRGESDDGLVVLDGERTLGFLDQRPLFPGHTLLIPREHIETLSDLPDELLPEFFANARLLARAMEEGLGAEGSFVAINNRVSQSVPHLHVHVAPRRRKDGLRGFFWPRQKYESEAQAEEVAERLRRAVAQLRREGAGRPRPRAARGS